MYGLTNEEKLEHILKTSKDLGVSPNDFGDNTEISTMGAYNILNGISKNPRTKNLNIMMKYLEKLQLGKNKNENKVEEPPGSYAPSLETIIYNMVYDKVRVEIEDINKKLSTLQAEIEKLKKK